MTTPSPIVSDPTFTIAALYKFVDLAPEQIQSLQESLRTLCETEVIQGTLLLAAEGLNGTVAGSAAAIDTLLAELRAEPAFADIDVKLSTATAPPFNRLKIKHKREIVTMGDANVRPLERVGTYIEPEEWNDLIRDPDVVVIDTRNDYEYRVGHFDGAIQPDTGSFTEFPKYVREHLDPTAHKRIAMYCTGGIRCEKSTSLLVDAGFEAVYHLHGGILRYLERVPEAQSLWRGECFVFDQRVSLTHGLREGTHVLCFACQQPLAPEHVALDSYEEGVSCAFCIESLTPERQARLRERMHQLRRAHERGERHIGDGSPAAQQARETRPLAARAKASDP